LSARFPPRNGWRGMGGASASTGDDLLRLRRLSSADWRSRHHQLRQHRYTRNLFHRPYGAAQNAFIGRCGAKLTAHDCPKERTDIAKQAEDASIRGPRPTPRAFRSSRVAGTGPAESTGRSDEISQGRGRGGREAIPAQSPGMGPSSFSSKTKRLTGCSWNDPERLRRFTEQWLPGAGDRALS